MKSTTAKKAKKGLFSVIFSRTAVVMILLLIQILMLFGVINYLEAYAKWVYALFILISVFVIIKIINGNDNPAFKMAWMIPIMVVPIAGGLFYVWVQTQLGTKYIGRRGLILGNETKPYLAQNREVIDSVRVSKASNANLAHYMSKQAGYPMYRNTEVSYFPLGEDMFKELLVQLEKAEKFIFMEFFIVEEGLMWNSILEILKRKARDGVEVRFMYDGTCSISLLPYHYPKKLKHLGIKCKQFNPIKPVLSTYQNNRDHRKICVIDGKTAFTGGVNLADEYINKRKRFGHWKDTAVMLKGEAVQSFTMMFLQMWNVDERRTENYSAYLSEKSNDMRHALGYVMPYADSPFDNENIGEQVYLHILNHAKKYVHIMTPYLILDNEVVTTLTYAAKSGIEVIIIMPYVPDKWYAFAVAKTYYAELIDAGVEIYEYLPGFVHAKVFVSDDDTAAVGTINLDYRSLYLHFECGAYIYNNQVVRDVEKDFQETLARCRRVSILDVKNRSIWYKIVGNVLRLFAPLM